MSRRFAYRLLCVLIAIALFCPLLATHAQEDAPATWRDYAQRVGRARQAVDAADGELMDSRAGSDLAAEVYRLLPARERVDMPPPGAAQPARLAVSVRDLVWDALYAPIAAGLAVATEKLNHLQFLTIRKYLSLMFAALVGLLLAVAIWR